MTIPWTILADASVKSNKRWGKIWFFETKDFWVTGMCGTDILPPTKGLFSLSFVYPCFFCSTMVLPGMIGHKMAASILYLATADVAESLTE